MIQVMSDQEDDKQLNEKWLTANDWLTYFIKDRYSSIRRFKGAELPSVEGPYYSEEEVFLGGRVTSRT